MGDLGGMFLTSLMATKLEGEELSSKRLVKYKQSFTLTVIEYRYYYMRLWCLIESLLPVTSVILLFMSGQLGLALKEGIREI